MKTFFADKEGNYLGGSTSGMPPENAEHQTDQAPSACNDIFNPELNCWQPADQASPVQTGKCNATTKAGAPCKGKPVTGSEFCRWHQ